MSSPGLRRTNAGVTLGYRTPILWSSGDITAAGDDQDTAALLLHTVNHVAGADGDTGVILPVGSPGQIVEVSNVEGAANLKVYPHSGGSINGGTGDAAITVLALSHALFVCAAADSWAAIYTAP